MRCGRPVRSDMCGREGRRRARTFVFARGIVSVDSIRLAARSSASLAGKMRGVVPPVRNTAARYALRRFRPCPYGWICRFGRGRKVPSHFGSAPQGAEPVSRPAVPARFSPSRPSGVSRNVSFGSEPTSGGRPCLRTERSSDGTTYPKENRRAGKGLRGTVCGCGPVCGPVRNGSAASRHRVGRNAPASWPSTRQRPRLRVR